MGDSIFIGASFVASFIAGMIALFAPCCISFLLPAYFGTLFKERTRVLFMTVVYSLGIFSVFFPMILGAHVLFLWFMRFHDEVFLVGSIFMMAMGIVILLGLTLPMPSFIVKIQSKQKLQGVGNVYVLGLLSGITSSCCAPVLLGVLTFSALSANMWQAVGIGIFYVLGMVFPLYLASLALEKKKVLGRTLFQKRIVGGRVTISQFLAFAIFFGTGSVLFVLTLLGKIQMEAWARAFAQKVGWITTAVNNLFRGLPVLDALVAIGIGGILLTIIIVVLRNRRN